MVFTLLESLYGQFDELAAKRRIFKVETIGGTFRFVEALGVCSDLNPKFTHMLFKLFFLPVKDCYVAVSGLPDPNPQHHLAMARFARDCLTTFECLTQELERELGPGTSDLGLRIGLHSGPVTAGVLRGDRARCKYFFNAMARTSVDTLSNNTHLYLIPLSF